MTEKGNEFIQDTKKILVVCALIIGLMFFAHWAWSAGDSFSVEKDCPTLYELGLRGEMEVKSGMIFLEEKVKEMRNGKL